MLFSELVEDMKPNDKVKDKNDDDENKAEDNAHNADDLCRPAMSLCSLHVAVTRRTHRHRWKPQSFLTRDLKNIGLNFL